MNPEQDIVAPLWVADDVLCIANEREITLTEEQVEYIMDEMERHHDASIGINWDVIDGTIDWVVNS